MEKNCKLPPKPCTQMVKGSKDIKQMILDTKTLSKKIFQLYVKFHDFWRPFRKYAN